MWTGLVLGLGAGIAATPHCLGMCGGFPLHLARSRRGSVVLRQVLFVAGKSFTYIFLGALASMIGVIVFRNTALAPGAPVLRVGVGLLTALFGLLMLGLRLPSIGAVGRAAEAGLVRSLFSGLLVDPGPTAAFVLGLGVGFIPCPLPIAMLAIAAASHDMLYGMTIMAGVGLGTAPGLLGIGLFGAGLHRGLARVGTKAAGVAVLVIGLLTICRATGIIPAGHAVNHILPPCCAGHHGAR